MNDADRPTSGLAGRLRAGETVFGVVVKMPAPAIVELCGHVGLDFVLIDTEHGVADSGELEHHLRAADSAGIRAVVRVGASPGGVATETLRALDAGAAGVVVPHVNTRAEAEAAVAAAHYPPVGRRGLAVSTRAGRHGLVPVADHVEAALNETVVIVQVEDAKALAHVAAIAATPRLDAVFLGPNDLATSLGVPGQLSHPTVGEAVERIVHDVNGSGAALCVLAGDEDEAREWERRGARIILFAAASLLAERMTRLARELRAPGVLA